MGALSQGRDRELAGIANTIRQHIVRMIAEAGSGHPGGSLSAVEIITALYFHFMKVDPENLFWPDRDRFVLSKGHGCPALYAALAEKGFFPREDLMTLRKIDSHLQGHPHRASTPGVEVSTGSLGQGLAQAVGMGLASRLDGARWRVYCLLGDGELQEGMVWEAAMSAAHFCLDNLTAMVDWNGLQIDGRCSQVMNLEPLDKKWQAFGWHTLTVDGHDFAEIIHALEEARATRDRPSVILARTVKGRGVSFMEDQAGWHGVAPDAEQLARALKELEMEGQP